MARLDVELQSLLGRWEHRDRNAGDPDPRIPPDLKLLVGLVCTAPPAGLDATGFITQHSHGPVIYGSVLLRQLRAVSELPEVTSVQLQRSPETHLNDSVPDILADQLWAHTGLHFTGYTGKGVIVGIVDSGIDFRHMNFRKEGTGFAHTRILRIWDQTLKKQIGEDAPGPVPDIVDPTRTNPLGYGVEYTERHINDTLGEEVSVPAVVPVRHKDTNGHGTHVAGIAAGNGWASGACHSAFHYVGVAPEANLVVVRLWGLTKGDDKDTNGSPIGAPSSSVVQDAMAYIFDVARQLGMPAVVNMSVGKFTEYMNGNSKICLDLDVLQFQHPTGRAIVISAGNDADLGFHAAARVPAGPPAPNKVLSLPFVIHDKDKDARHFTVLYSGQNLEAQLKSPIEGAAGTITWVSRAANLGESVTANGAGTGSLVQIINNNGQISVSLTPPKDSINRSGTWTLELRDSGSTETPIDALCLYGSSHDLLSPRWKDHVTVRSTLSEYATGREILAVGNARVGGALNPSSGRGPTMDNRPAAGQKPDLAAPGTNIASARSSVSNLTADGCMHCCCDCCLDTYTSMDGTSMSSPHVAGAIALMLHKNPTLTYQQIRTALITHTTAVPAGTPPDDTLGWGAGRLNAKSAVDSVAQVNPPVASLAHAPEQRPATWRELQERWLSMPRGPRLAGLIERHAREVWSLIQTNRRVATIWHRCRGPVWARLALLAVQTPDRPVPVQIEALTLQASLRRFGAALRRYGSPELAESVDEVQPEIDRIADGMSLVDLMQALGHAAQIPSPSPRLEVPA